MVTDPGVILAVQLPPQDTTRLAHLSRWPVERRTDPAELGEHLDEGTLAVVLGPDVVDPIGLCRQVRRLDPEVPILVLAREARHAAVSSALQVAPLIGRDTYCVAMRQGDDQGWIGAVLAAAQGEARRRTHAGVIARIRSGPELMPPPPAVSQYLGQLLEHAPIGVVTLDDAGFVRGWNPRATVIFGRRPGDIIGSPMLGLFPDSEHRSLLDAWAAAVRSDDGVTVICSRTSVTGAPQHLELVLASIDANVPSRGCLVLVHDVTEEQRNRQALTSRAREAELRAEVAMALTAGGPLGAKAERLVGALVRHLGAGIARLWLWDPDEGRLVLGAEAGPAVPADTRAEPDDVVRKVAGTRRPRHGGVETLPGPVASSAASVAFVGHPLVVDGELLGVMAVHGDDRLDEIAEWGLAPIADAVAMAIARDRAEDRVRELLAREHEARRRAELAAEQHATLARTLQRSLLPPQLPDIAGFEVAAEYHWAGDGSVIGGDFYDVFPLADGRWCAAIGDVTGKGAEAAALTAMARHTLRTAALTARSTSGLLATLNEALLTTGMGRRLCTVGLLAVSLRGDGAEVEVNLAGHPPPFLLRDGRLVDVDAPHNPLVGVFAGRPYRHHVITLERGDIVVLHTDGATEVRGPDGVIGDEATLEFLASGTWTTAAELVASLLQAIIDQQGGNLRDDVALLALRCDVDR